MLDYDQEHALLLLSGERGLAAYLLYLRACGHTFSDALVGFIGGRAGCGSGRDCFGPDFSAVGGRLVDAVPVLDGTDVCDSFVSGSGDCFGGNVGFESGRAVTVVSEGETGGDSGFVGGARVGVSGDCNGDLCSESPKVSGASPDAVVRGVHYERNKAKREKEKNRRREARASVVPEWRRSAGAVGSAASSATTVTAVTASVAEEVEARRTLAMRRVAENKVAAKMAELRLVSLSDADKTAALAKLELARIQERINTATAKSQASYKKCDSPLDSVGSAGSAGEFAWKQEIRKRDAIVVERDYLRVQLDEMLKTATPEMKRAVAAIPEPHIPTDEEIAAMDEDIAPYMSQAEMEAETERYFSRTDIFFERD